MSRQPAQGPGCSLQVPAPHALEENRRLRRALRDVVALSTLPAVWNARDREQIARSLGAVLLNTLSLEAVCLRLAAGASRSSDVFCGNHEPRLETALTAALAGLLDADRGESTRSIPDPSGQAPLQVAFVRFGIGADRGALVACSRKPDFPTEHDRLLLGVGVNQMAMVLQRRQAEEGVRDQREWLRVTLESIGDAVIATDIEGRVTFMNAVAEELTGWAQDEARGEPLATVFRICQEETGQPLESPVDRVLREGRIVGRANHTVLMAKDGTERSIDHSAAPIRDAAGIMLGIVMVFRSAVQQRRKEQLRNARLALTHVLNQSADVQEAARGLLQAACETLGWDAGLFWIADGRSGRLACQGHWHTPGAALSRFVQASRGTTFESGAGLPGRVWASGESTWIRDLAADPDFRRLGSAADAGLRCAFACPVVVRRPDAGRDRVLCATRPRARPRSPGDDGLGRRQLRPVHRAQGRRGRLAAKRGGAGRLLRERHRRPALGGARRHDPEGQSGRAGDARLPPRRVPRPAHRGVPCRPGGDRRHPREAGRRREAGRVSGAAALQGRLDEGGPDRLERPVEGRRVRPHPVLHPGRDRATAGRGRAGRHPCPARRRARCRRDRDLELGHPEQPAVRGQQARAALQSAVLRPPGHRAGGLPAIDPPRRPGRGHRGARAVGREPHALRGRLPRRPVRRLRPLGHGAGPGRVRRRRARHQDAGRAGRHHRAQAAGRGVARRRPAQGRVPGHARARAPQSPGADQYLPGVAEDAAHRRGHAGADPGDDGAPAAPAGAAGRRPARRVPGHARQDRAARWRRSSWRPSSPGRSRRCSR